MLIYMLRIPFRNPNSLQKKITLKDTMKEKWQYRGPLRSN